MRTFFLPAVTLAIALSACSGATLTASDAGQGSHTSPEAGDSPVATPEAGSTPDGGPETGVVLYAIDSTIARIHIDFELLPSAPGCFAAYRPVDYDRRTRTMSWPGCQQDAGLFDASQSGPDYAAVTRVLSQSEAQEVESVLATVTYENNPPCGGYDGFEYFMTTYDDAGNVVRKYSGQNVNCYGYPAAFLIHAVYDELAKLRG